MALIRTAYVVDPKTGATLEQFQVEDVQRTDPDGKPVKLFGPPQRIGDLQLIAVNEMRAYYHRVTEPKP